MEYSYWKIEEFEMQEKLNVYDDQGILIISFPLTELVEMFLAGLDLKQEQMYAWKN